MVPAPQHPGRVRWQDARTRLEIQTRSSQWLTSSELDRTREEAMSIEILMPALSPTMYVGVTVSLHSAGIPNGHFLASAAPDVCDWEIPR